jgi:hypothetical protein
MKRLAIAAMALAMTGCASLQDAGIAEYTVTPVFSKSGPPAYKVSIVNGKQIATLDAKITKQDQNYTVSLHEVGIEAFKGQQISAQALQSAVHAAVVSALIGAGIMAAPAAAPLIGAMGASGLGAAALGGVGVLGVQKAIAAPTTAVPSPVTAPAISTGATK